MVADRVAADVSAVADEIAEGGGSAAAVTADVTSDADARCMVKVAQDRFGALHICFNNAGIDLPHARSVTETTEEDWRRIFDVNVLGVFLVARAALPAILEAGGGTVVNTASVAGLAGMRGEAAYGASKGAVIALTRQMAVDYAPDVRVNALCPGMVERATRDRRATLDRAALARRADWAAAAPLARYGSYDEMARAALWLASDESSFVTGTALVVDGGMLAL